MPLKRVPLSELEGAVHGPGGVVFRAGLVVPLLFEPRLDGLRIFPLCQLPQNVGPVLLRPRVMSRRDLTNFPMCDLAFELGEHREVGGPEDAT